MFLCFGRRSDVLHIEYSARTVEHSDNGNDEDSIILHYRRYRISKRLISAMLDVIGYSEAKYSSVANAIPRSARRLAR